MPKSYFVSFLLALIMSAPLHSFERPADQIKLIYGEDDRHDVVDYHDALFRDHAQSVAGMVRASSLGPDPQNPDRIRFPLLPARYALRLCPEERFSEQYTLPYCTGFLVADDLLLTAGHCVETERRCASFKWAFGFKKGVQSLAKKDVYGCKEIVGQELESTFAKIKDYTLIRLDRKVLDRTPLEYRTKGKARIGDPLIVIGHPSGLPLKISNGAKVSRMNWRELSIFFSTLFRKRYYFLANLDTYAGNSGSPVFNRETGLVEGLLIEGGDDFIMDEERGCSVSNRKSNSRWTTEEMVYRITKIPELQEDN
jgi:hypothetical protein